MKSLKNYLKRQMSNAHIISIKTVEKEIINVDDSSMLSYIGTVP